MQEETDTTIFYFSTWNINKLLLYLQKTSKNVNTKKCKKNAGRNGHDDKQASSGIGQQGNHRGDTSATDKVLIYSW